MSLSVKGLRQKEIERWEMLFDVERIEAGIWLEFGGMKLMNAVFDKAITRVVVLVDELH